MPWSSSESFQEEDVSEVLSLVTGSTRLMKAAGGGSDGGINTTSFLSSQQDVMV